ncbi:hypothetical protein ABOM_001079 [Aspergillus bombycis]|uniref:Zn(2)-C6 fungal-type domain-containing protein n=1 Tax=Aspergillus bombycis TaxID=109264 RepID=A0A1F8AG76_9EURO|nr:hypothetical protein ABOM_001079 [Aspergillus bombycis]OGM50345.1 hypothetical protein ABOM_001079 [Aspergillus bombycis]
MTFSPPDDYMQFPQIPHGPNNDCNWTPINELQFSLPFCLTPPDSDLGQSVSSVVHVGEKEQLPRWTEPEPGWLDSLESSYQNQKTDTDSTTHPYSNFQINDRTSTAPAVPDHQEPYPDSATTQKQSTGRRIRRQNHSCDPCRLAKRGCDLPRGVAISGNKPTVACTMCSLRSMECTVAWLASRKPSRHTQRRAETPPRSPAPNRALNSQWRPTEDVSHVQGLTLLPRAEWDQAKQLEARERCVQHLYLYIDVVDMQIATCLSERCMPPCYSLGIDALAPLSNSADVSPYLERARSSINNCWYMNLTTWNSTSATPNLYLAVSLLDALFQRPGLSQGPTSRNMRDEAIDETYKWVAIAIATQFTVQENNQRETAKSHSWARDIAFATWQKAREMLFKNIGATRSFRLALSLILFGGVLPPTGLEQSEMCAEDIAYAHREGARRLRALCSNARVYLQENNRQRSPPLSSSNAIGAGTGRRKSHIVQAFSPEVRQYILEVVGAIEWFFWMSHSVTVVMSRERTDPTSLDLQDTSINKLPLRGPAQPGNLDELKTRRHEQEIEDSILTRARPKKHNVSTLWSKNASCDVVDRAVTSAGSLIVLLWRSLALLTIASQDLLTGLGDGKSFQRHYNATTVLIDSWREAFGPITSTTIMSLQASRADVQRRVLFCATDGDLAILLFDELIRELEVNLMESLPAGDSLHTVLRSTSAYRQEERLASAMNISYLASFSIRVPSPGLQGDHGLKANVQDIAAHPQPALVVKAYTLAAKTLADEIQRLMAKMETGSVYTLTNGLNHCLQGLQALEKTLVMFPNREDTPLHLLRGIYPRISGNESFVQSLAKIMTDGSDIVFTDSLSEQNRTIVPIEQLKSAINIAPGRIRSTKILQISASTVLKVGRAVKMDEAEALLLVAAKTKVPVPKVYTAYTIGEIGFILMGKIEGKSLGSCLDDMPREVLQRIAYQLKSYICEWRELSSSFLGSVNGGPCRDIIFRHPWDYTSTKQYGPFYSFEQYRHGVVEALRLSRPPGIWYEEEEELKDRVLSFTKECSSSLGLMTHGDLHPGNIIIKDGQIEGIVDWGDAGYSLPEREYFAAKRIAMDPIWIEMIDSAIPCFQKEYEIWDEVDRSMRRYSPV